MLLLEEVPLAARLGVFKGPHFSVRRHHPPFDGVHGRLSTGCMGGYRLPDGQPSSVPSLMGCTGRFSFLLQLSVCLTDGEDGEDGADGADGEDYLVARVCVLMKTPTA